MSLEVPNVLHFNDEENELEIFRLTIENCGGNSTNCHDPQELEAYLQSGNKPDVVFLDHELGLSDNGEPVYGEAFAPRIRQFCPDVLIAMFSKSASNFDYQQLALMFEAGIDLVANKPTEFVVVERLVKSDSRSSLREILKNGRDIENLKELFRENQRNKASISFKGDMLFIKS